LEIRTGKGLKLVSQQNDSMAEKKETTDAEILLFLFTRATLFTQE